MKRAQTAGLSDRSVFYRYRLFKKITKTCRICLLTSIMMPFATLVFLSFFSRFTFFSLFPFTYIDIIFIFLIFSRDGIKRIYRHGILYRIYGGCNMKADATNPNDTAARAAAPSLSFVLNFFMTRQLQAATYVRKDNLWQGERRMRL